MLWLDGVDRILVGVAIQVVERLRTLAGERFSGRRELGGAKGGDESCAVSR